MKLNKNIQSLQTIIKASKNISTKESTKESKEDDLTKESKENDLTKESKEKGYTGIKRSTGRGINAPSIVAFFFRRKP